MKFLLELMACCGCSSRLPPLEDIGPLVPGPAQPTNRKNRRRRRGRGGPTSSVGSVPNNWRPSLSAISEDNALPPRKVKRKVITTSPPATKPRRRSCEETRRIPVSALAPAFSPTPFLF
ncbi:hypothetical protein MTR67_033199 [Solanum verrucosum]|uniref:Uncharacterized protein n=2 Tax=Solanum TaxID=4107 RepID=A0AAF0ZJY9_SOLVR|nr:uncharacterized protein LOC125809319 [Solanum verrucosum]WMV39814.1 hypothetical protein MTR67_033199 [Solanum verrucosum]